MIDLDLYRKEKNTWIEVSYNEANSDERGSFDSNEKKRYSLLISLQYDFKKSDEELIRYLFEQEIIAREKDDFQGIGDTLWLGAYLLARFSTPLDISLFYRAKFANFDTGCGFDREFMYIALREKTEEYVFQNDPELYDEVKGGFSSMGLAENLDSWWNKLSNRFPESESDEPIFGLYERSIYFEDKELAKKYLKKWKESATESEQKDSTLKYAYIELGEFTKAIELVKKELVSKKTNWDKASSNQDLLKLYTKMGGAEEGLDIIKAIDKQFIQFDNWRQVGLGRMAVHEAFEYTLASNDIDVARAAFRIAHSWFKKMNYIAFVGLEAGWKAADKCGFTLKARMYKKMAMKERRRIDNM
ncbi:MAG: hypothetical protein COA99_19720 [Moraxellaceae bacterium]|nr:MAG: hypothetical protein COA99_19720 [Moraxellaceae bacterium]